MDELTKPYDNFEIIRIGLRILFRISRHTRDRKYICSKLVYDCFDRIGVPFNLRDDYVVGVAGHHHLRLIGRQGRVACRRDQRKGDEPGILVHGISLPRLMAKLNNGAGWHIETGGKVSAAMRTLDVALRPSAVGHYVKIYTATRNGPTFGLANVGRAQQAGIGPTRGDSRNGRSADPGCQILRHRANDARPATLLRQDSARYRPTPSVSDSASTVAALFRADAFRASSRIGAAAAEWLPHHHSGGMIPARMAYLTRPARLSIPSFSMMRLR